jgi:pyruvate dehydrogenase (quinone)/pyruvate oxidase
MATTAADVLIEALCDWGVEVIFGLPGDGINGLMEALRIRQDKVRFVQVRHEETAAFMACGYAKYTGKLGVCLATSGPGGIHLLNGLYDAKVDGQPVLALTGLPYHDLISTYTQQDVELDKLFTAVISSPSISPRSHGLAGLLASALTIRPRVGRPLTGRLQPQGQSLWKRSSTPLSRRCPLK